MSGISSIAVLLSPPPTPTLLTPSSAPPPLLPQTDRCRHGHHWLPGNTRWILYKSYTVYWQYSLERWVASPVVGGDQHAPWLPLQGGLMILPSLRICQPTSTIDPPIATLPDGKLLNWTITWGRGMRNSFKEVHSLCVDSRPGDRLRLIFC